MGFLVITCIGPISKFLGLIPLSWSMVIMAAIVVAIAGYTYYESKVYFEKTKIFGFLTKDIYLGIELAIALLLFIAFLVKKKCYSRLMYLTTVAFGGFGLAINIHKLSVLELESGIKDEEQRFIKWLFFIRIGSEFLVEMMICYIAYSLKKYE